MATIKPVPSLGTQGWVTDDTNIMDLLLSHFFLSDYNQTQLYPGNVISLPEIIQKNSNQIDGIINELKNKLTNYLNRYYDDVEVNLEGDPDINTSPDIKFDLRISIVVKSNNGVDSYTNLIQTENSKLINIIKLNNFGG